MKMILSVIIDPVFQEEENRAEKDQPADSEETGRSISTLLIHPPFPS